MNELASIVVTDDGITILVNDEHPLDELDSNGVAVCWIISNFFSKVPFCLSATDIWICSEGFWFCSIKLEIIFEILNINYKFIKTITNNKQTFFQ